MAQAARRFKSAAPVEGEEHPAMSTTLGTLEELPEAYRDALSRQSVLPLWPMMRNLLPHGRPNPQTRPTLWEFERIRPLLLQAGELAPVEKAERRVLVLSDSGRGHQAMQVSGAIFCGMQLLLPGEQAPSHRHTPSAARIIVEGEGAYTVVDGERCAMERGDLILTPGGMWHEHGHDGRGPVIWLDALDLPLFAHLEASYAEEGSPQRQRNRPDGSELGYSEPGLVPSRRAGAARPRYPQLRYPWRRTQAALRRLAACTDESEAVELDHVNPETGESCLPTLGFTAMMLRPGEVRPPLCSASAVFHVIDGNGESTIDGGRFSWKRGDTFSAPVFARIAHRAQEEAFLMRIHDAPLQQKLGFFEERPA
jgi:gentisate 1,2-dioxygenase